MCSDRWKLILHFRNMETRSAFQIPFQSRDQYRQIWHHKEYSEEISPKNLISAFRCFVAMEGALPFILPDNAGDGSNCGKRTSLFWVKLIQTQEQLSDLKYVRPSNMNFINSSTDPLHTFG